MPRLAFAFVVVLAGCGSGYAEIAVVHAFPTTEDLAALDAPLVPARPGLAIGDSVEVDLPNPPPLGEGTAAVEGGALAALLGSGGRRVRATTGMRCAAEALARYYLRERARPRDAVVDHVLGRCGVASIDPAIAVHLEEVGVDPPEAAAGPEEEEGATVDDAAARMAGFRSLADDLRPALGEDTPFALEVGSAFVEGDGVRVWLGLACTSRVAASVTRLEDGRFLLAGRVETERVRAVEAWVSLGEYGVDRCEADASVELPDLRFVCAMNPHDASARVDLLAIPRQRLSTRHLGRILLYADDDAARVYRARPALPAGNEEADLVGRLSAALTSARSEAGQVPLRLSVAESERQAPFLEKLLAARVAAADPVVEELTLGFVAGWSVGAPLVGGVVHVVESTSRDPFTALSEELASPAARSTLLSPEYDFVAITARESSRGLDATLTMYRAFDPEELDQIGAAFRAHLDAERRRAAVRPLVYLDDVADLQQEADKVTAEGIHPREALDDAMARLRGRLGRTVRCYHDEAYDPRWVELPIEFQDSGDVSAVTGVAFHRPVGAAWGQLAFFVCVFPE